MVRDPEAPWAEAVLMTADELMALPEDAWRYELVQGRLVRMPLRAFHRSVSAGHLVAALYGFVEERGSGMVTAPGTGFLLSKPGEPDTVLAPDTAFIPAARIPARDSPEWQGYPRHAPDLVVEFGEPGQDPSVIAAKIKVWLDAGTQIAWGIWPASQQVDVWHAGAGSEVRTLRSPDVLDGEDVLPGFTFPIADLWQ